jgi:hypothetical protein
MSKLSKELNKAETTIWNLQNKLRDSKEQVSRLERLCEQKQEQIDVLQAKVKELQSTQLLAG